MKPAWRRALWCAAPVVALAAAYLPDLGRGFVKDDFAWILGSRADVLSVFAQQNGFYRPLVSLSFTLNEWMFGLHPLGYGLTNFALVLLAGAGIYLLARSLGMDWGLATLCAALWALNPHGVGGAILWISGRTSLLLTVFALAAAIALVRGRLVLAALGCAGALFSKEEAVLLPAILFVWAGLESTDEGLRWRWRPALTWAAVALVPVALYLVLRGRTAAFLPLSAPAYYRFTFEPALLLRNALEYADRGGTIMAATAVLASLVAWRRPRLDAAERGWAIRGVAWFILGFGLTVFVPVRSSLYACFPSVGAALAAAAAVRSVWRQAAPRRRTVLAAAALVVPFALTPVLRSRNERMARTADLSARVLEAVRPRAAELAQGHVLVLHDDPGSKVTIRNAFGTLLADAVRLETGTPSPRVWIEPPPPEWQAAGVPRPRGPAEIHLALRHGALVPLDR